MEIVGLDDGLTDGTSVGDKLGKSEGDDEGLSVGLCNYIDYIEKRDESHTYKYINCKMTQNLLLLVEQS